MNRRHFIALSAAGVAQLMLADLPGNQLWAKSHDRKRYSVVILGDTHYDTEPASVYHSDYNETVEWLNRVQRAEFARNGEMWRERCPQLLHRAAGLVRKDTRMALQMGDLIQGDCGNPEVHAKMLIESLDYMKHELHDLPFVTVVGNHDIRGTGAEECYHRVMPERMSLELGVPVGKTTFSYNIDDDAYIVVDFNKPDYAELERQLEQTKGARHTFVVSHGPIFPFDASSCRWFFLGGKSSADARRHFRALFAQRNAICLCGHVHRTELLDWQGDGGRITQLTMNSVWTEKTPVEYNPMSVGAESYGLLRKDMKNDDGTPIADEMPLFDEYRPGLLRYEVADCAGSYRLCVDGEHVNVEFYGGASKKLTRRFELR